MNIAAFSIVSKGDNRRVHNEITADRRRCASDCWSILGADLAIRAERIDLAVDGVPDRDSNRHDNGKRATPEWGAANQLPGSDRDLHVRA